MLCDSFLAAFRQRNSEIHTKFCFGGLVRRGEPGKLEDTIIAALENAKWCSSDPICISSLGQGPESLNRAACHNCALLPETCCECGNRLLDRGLVVGELTEKRVGYFSDL